MVEIRENSDLLSVKHGFIMHQVNYLGIMGGGLALQIKRKWPDVFKKYSDWLKDEKEYLKNLYRLYRGGGLDRQIIEEHTIGKCIYVNPEGEADDLMVCNVFAQRGGIGKTAQTDYQVWMRRFDKIKRYAETLYPGIPKSEDKISINIPWKLGCGLAHGDWSKMEEIIKNSFEDCEERLIIHKFEG